MIETCWSDFKCFNVKCYVSALVGVIIKLILQNAQCNNKDNFTVFIPRTGKQLDTKLCTRVRKLLHVKRGKAVPLQAWRGPEGSRKVRFPDFMTTAQDSGKVVSLTHRPHLPPGNTPGIHFC